jgi:IS1 family transposase
VGPAPSPTGKACAAYHDEHVRNLKTRRVQVDELWSFTYSKQKNVANAKRKDLAYRDTWTWTAIDAESKLMITWLVGGRDSDYAIALMDDLRARLANRVQLTTDGHRAYLGAVEGAFGGDIKEDRIPRPFCRALRDGQQFRAHPPDLAHVAGNGGRRD